VRSPGFEPSVVTTSVTTWEEDPAEPAAKPVLAYESDEDEELPRAPPKTVKAVAVALKCIPQTPTKSNRGQNCCWHCS